MGFFSYFLITFFQSSLFFISIVYNIFFYFQTLLCLCIQSSLIFIYVYSIFILHIILTYFIFYLNVIYITCMFSFFTGLIDMLRNADLNAKGRCYINVREFERPDEFRVRKGMINAPPVISRD